jgi:uncharacterized protein (TIGR03118 family)
MKTAHLGLLSLALVTACGSKAAESTSSTAGQISADSRAHIVQTLSQTNLVSDQPGVAATTDPNLVNAWGISFNPAGPAWVSDNGTGVTTVYDATGALKLTVTVPAPGSADAGTTSAPTGQVFNGTSDFGGDLFIFATEDGTISGWQPKKGAVLHVDNSAGGDNSAVYKGIAMGSSKLYVTNFRAGTVEVYDANYQPTSVSGGFVDPYLPRGFAPFNVFIDGARVFVSYAKQDDKKHDDVKGAGLGFVDLYDGQGHFQQRLISGHALNAPWALATAPAAFGDIGGALLVGNFGDGRINVYDLDDDGYGHLQVDDRGAIGDATGAAISIDGLWGLAFSPNADQNRLYFAAGPSGETHGLFGRLELPPPCIEHHHGSHCR